MSEQSRVRSATDEDLERDFGPGRLLTGHGGHFVLKEPANGFTADTSAPIAEP